MPVRILVTGHGGYIGATLVPILLAEGHEVTGLDTGYFEGCDFGPPGPAVHSLAVDLRDVTPDHLADMDAVVHLAALSNDPLGDIRPDLTLDVNLTGTVRLAAAARAAGVRRFLQSSSCSLYGAGASEELDEDAPFHPVTPYGETKVLGEQAVAALADGSFEPVFLRNATAYGISPRLRGDIVVNNLVGHAVTSGVIRLQSDGTAWRPLVHVRDICAAFVACLTAPATAVAGRAFNVGRPGENYRIIDVARLVHEVVPEAEVHIASGASSDARDYRVTFDRIVRDVPGFVPAWTLRRGIEELVEAYTSGGLDERVWSSDRFFRLPRIRALQAAKRLDMDLRWVGDAPGPE